MSAAPFIADTGPGDWAALTRLYGAAFADEDLVPLVESVCGEDGVISLAARVGAEVVGHVLFTPCAVGVTEVALLAPLAVAPQWQRQGIGGGLVRAGLARLAEEGFAAVFVLGDPAYYARFGFAAETGIAPPYRLPDAWAGAWQSLALGAGGQLACSGDLRVPPPWQRPELWRD